MKTFASLCTGFGLMDIGAQQADYQPIWGVEIDPILAEVAEANLQHYIYSQSMIGFKWSKADRPDHLHISPPCQNASIANSKKGETELDLAIAQSCCDALDYYQPDSFTLENVRGYQAFKSLHKIVDKLWGLGYWVNADVLNAADFGVPQDRHRLIVRAVKGGIPLPLQQESKRSGWYAAIEDLIPNLTESSFAQWQLNLLPEMYKTMLTDSGKNASRVATVRKECDPNFTATASSLIRPSHTPKAFIVNGMANSHGRDVTVADADSPVFTITASQSKRPLRSWLENGRVVSLNSRAIARLQTMPDWYELPSKAALAGKGIGSGVPCLMAQRVLEAIA